MTLKARARWRGLIARGSAKACIRTGRSRRSAIVRVLDTVPGVTDAAHGDLLSSYVDTSGRGFAVDRAVEAVGQGSATMEDGSASGLSDTFWDQFPGGRK